MAADSSALARVQQEPSRAFEPSGIEEAYRLSKVLVASGLMPEGVRTPEAAFAIIATGRELGLTAMQSLRSIHVIKGKPCLSADLICALVKGRSDVCEYFRLAESTEQVAMYVTKRRGEPEPTTMRFTLEDARRAQLLGNGNWTKFPAAMLRARCITALARAVYPDLVMGLYDPDELQSPQPATVVREVVPKEAPRAEVADQICADIEAAASVQTINIIAVEAKRRHTAGTLSDHGLARVADAIKAKRAAMAAEVETVDEGEGS